VRTTLLPVAGGDVGAGAGVDVDGGVIAVVAVGRDRAPVVVLLDAAGEPPPAEGDVVAGPLLGEPPSGIDPSPSASRASSAVRALGWLSVTLRPTSPTPCQASRTATAAAATHPIP
jgi:hypothetical protein